MLTFISLRFIHLLDYWVGESLGDLMIDIEGGVRRNLSILYLKLSRHFRIDKLKSKKILNLL